VPNLASSGFPGLGFADPRTGYAEALEHGARLVGDDGDGAEVVLVEIPCRDGLVAVLDVHADEAAGGHQVVGPTHGATGARELLGVAEIERGAAGCGLLEALVLGVVGETDAGGATRDRGRLVVGGIGDGEAVAGGHVAFGVPRARLRRPEDRLR